MKQIYLYLIMLSFLSISCTQKSFEIDDVLKSTAFTSFFSLNTIDIRVSNNSNRSNSQSLNGQRLPENGKYYVFINDSSSITQAQFYLNGQLVKTENLAPFDMAGTLKDNSAYPLDVLKLKEGQNIVTVRINSDSSTDTVAAFKYGSGPPLDIMASNLPNRSNAKTLNGSSLTPDDPIFIFVPNDGLINKVDFYLNGQLVKSESLAPYDMAGTLDTDLAYPLDHSSLKSGENTVKIVVNNDSSLSHSVSFTYNNQPKIQLMHSSNPDRSSASPLSGVSLKSNDQHYVFLKYSDKVLPTQVKFYINGSLVQTENNAPYDLGGTESNGDSVAIDNTKLNNGKNILKASVLGSETLETSVEVSLITDREVASIEPEPVENTDTSSEPNTGIPSSNQANLMHSSSANRSNEEALDGMNIDKSSNHYIFLSLNSSFQQVDFYLDGGHIQKEGTAPYDMGGTNSDDSSRPLDLSEVSEGSHKISVKVDGSSNEFLVAQFNISSSTNSVPTTTTPTTNTTEEPTSGGSEVSIGSLTLTGSSKANQKLTIKGQGFGSGPHIVVYDDFEGQPGEAIQKTSPITGEWSATVSEFGYVSRFHDYGYSGTSYSMVDVYNPNSRWGAKQAQLSVDFQDTQEVFMSYQIAIPPGKVFPGADGIGSFGEKSHWKITWLMDGANGFQTANKADVCMPTNGQAKGLQISGNTDKIGWVANLDSDFDLNNFNRMTGWLKANPSSPYDSGYSWFQMISTKLGKTKTREFDGPVFNGEVAGLSYGQVSTKWNRVNVPGWYGNNIHPETGGVYDDFYLATGANAPARVEVGSQSVYENNTDLTIMPSSSWSNNEIQVLVKSKSNQNIAGKYLFIFNGNNKLIYQVQVPANL